MILRLCCLGNSLHQWMDCCVFCQELLTEICSENPDDVGDLYLDIAEAYMNVGLYTSAKPILVSLVTSAQYNMVCNAVNCKKELSGYMLASSKYLIGYSLIAYSSVMHCISYFQLYMSFNLLLTLLPLLTSFMYWLSLQHLALSTQILRSQSGQWAARFRHLLLFVVTARTLFQLTPRSTRSSLNVDRQVVVDGFVRRNADVFSASEFDLGWTKLLQHSVEITSSKPVRQALRRHPVAYLPLITLHYITLNLE